MNERLISKFFNSSENANIQSPIYFNRTDVKKAINAPLDTEWTPCSNNNVFNTTDGENESLPPAFTVLPSVIERNVRTVIVHGLADFDLLSDGFVPFLLSVELASVNLIFLLFF